MLFPARNGSLRNLNNFGRVWRAARGEKYVWVTPRTFRRVVATVVDNAYGDPERAARQLGNTEAVAKAHYIDIPETFPDNRRSSSGGRAGTARKREISVRSARIPDITALTKIPSDPGRRGFSRSG
ncbi:hypothetical protein [Nocardia sp. MDA0666]|uniref:hypothetical protein n=1 Tax=Nocardia sp. MDA0666 TaxID=2135448 RepID=UPI0011B1D1F8|nr:hypothetical protein [Nocardia sp. MDA0666]